MLSEKKTANSAGFERAPEIGWANLLVSRIMMFVIIDRKIGLVAEVYEKRPTRGDALPKRQITTSRFLTYSVFVGKSAMKSVKSGG
jgi:hypothetical protein